MLAFVMEDAVKEHSMDKDMGRNKEKKKKESSCCEARALKNAQTPFSPPLLTERRENSDNNKKQQMCTDTHTENTHTHISNAAATLHAC